MPVARWRTRNCADRPAAPPRRTMGGDYLSALASVKGKSKRRVKRGEVSAGRWPNSNPGRLAVVVPDQGLVGFARATPQRGPIADRACVLPGDGSRSFRAAR